MYFLLFYNYIENIVEKRAPYREAHLALAQEYVARSELVLGGAYADPVDGAILLFKVEDQSDVEKFVAKDPYVVNGLVTKWQIRQWTVVVGSDL